MYRVKNDICINNAHVNCEAKNCEFCGWNEDVSEKRKTLDFTTNKDGLKFLKVRTKNA